MERVVALVVFHQPPMDVWLLMKEQKFGSALLYYQKNEIFAESEFAFHQSSI
jgi:hypothetical protein